MFKIFGINKNENKFLLGLKDNWEETIELLATLSHLNLEGNYKIEIEKYELVVTPPENSTKFYRVIGRNYFECEGKLFPKTLGIFSTHDEALHFLRINNSMFNSYHNLAIEIFYIPNELPVNPTGKKEDK